MLNKAIKKAKENKKGFTLAELLIVVAIIAVLVAISIPIFTSQLEKAREATDLANIRSAYAELTAEYLTAGSDATTGSEAQRTVAVTQKKEGWQSDNDEANTTIAETISVPAKTSGDYTVKISTAGVVTVE